MSYICTKNIKCEKCPHYRFDEENGRMACFALADEKQNDSKNQVKKHKT